MSSANIERTFSKLKWFQGGRRGNLSLGTLTHLGRIKILEGNENDTIGDTDGLAQYASYDQQKLVKQEDDSDSIFELDYNELVDFQNKRYPPELISDEDCWIWDEFNRYADFSIVN